MYGDEIIGCAGVAIPWPGFGIVWLQMSPVAALKFKVWMTRTCKRVIEDIERSMNFYRLEAIVVEDNIMNQRWIKALGFKQENGHATHYLPNGTNMIRYERVRNG
jgi:RimJ/RimL family protein N-acetyltransferase